MVSTGLKILATVLFSGWWIFGNHDSQSSLTCAYAGVVSIDTDIHSCVAIEQRKYCSLHTSFASLFMIFVNEMTFA